MTNLTAISRCCASAPAPHTLGCQVQRVSDVLNISGATCGAAAVPSAHRTAGVAASDYSIYVTTSNDGANSVYAYAGTLKKTSPLWSSPKRPRHTLSRLSRTHAAFWWLASFQQH